MAILGVTLTPGPNLPPLPQWELISFDTFVHALIFGGLTFLLSNSFREKSKDDFFKKYPLLTAFVSSTVFGVLIELIQPFVPGRTFSFHDIISNTIGCILGFCIVYIQWRFFIAAKES